MHQHLHYRGPIRRGQREKGPKKTFEAVAAENLLNMGKEINSKPSPGSSESPRQDKPKEEHPKTHSTKLTKTKDRDKILKRQGKSDK